MEKTGVVPARLLARGLVLLFELARRPDGGRLAALAAAAGLSRATSLRILRTLADLDVVTFDRQTKVYRLGPRLLRLRAASNVAKAAPAAGAVAQRAIPPSA